MLQIDGYTPPSADIAYKSGVTFRYPTAYGEIVITSRHSGRENTKFRMKMKVFNEWAERRRNLDAPDDKEADRRFISDIHDSLVTSWGTTIKSDGAGIDPTKENFVELMLAPATSHVFGIYLRDAGDEKQFRSVADEDRAGN